MCPPLHHHCMHACNAVSDSHACRASLERSTTRLQRYVGGHLCHTTCALTLHVQLLEYGAQKPNEFVPGTELLTLYDEAKEAGEAAMPALDCCALPALLPCCLVLLCFVSSVSIST